MTMEAIKKPLDIRGPIVLKIKKPGSRTEG
jgi:hypothetical protein